MIEIREVRLWEMWNPRVPRVDGIARQMPAASAVDAEEHAGVLRTGHDDVRALGVERNKCRLSVLEDAATDHERIEPRIGVPSRAAVRRGEHESGECGCVEAVRID